MLFLVAATRALGDVSAATCRIDKHGGSIGNPHKSKFLTV